MLTPQFFYHRQGTFGISKKVKPALRNVPTAGKNQGSVATSYYKKFYKKTAFLHAKTINYNTTYKTLLYS